MIRPKNLSYLPFILLLKYFKFNVITLISDNKILQNRFGSYEYKFHVNKKSKWWNKYIFLILENKSKLNNNILSEIKYK